MTTALTEDVPRSTPRNIDAFGSRAGAADDLLAPRRLSSGPGARERRRQASELERGLELAWTEAEVCGECVVIVEPGEKCGAERVAGADGVHDIDRGRGNSHEHTLAHAECTLRAERHHDQTSTRSKDLARSRHALASPGEPDD